MYRFILFFSVLISMASASAQTSGSLSAPGPFALGAELGNIVSVNGKYWLKSHEAIDFGLGVSTSSSTVVYADYLWHLPNLFGRNSQFGRETMAYFGAGGGLGIWTHTNNCSRWNCNVQTDSGTGIFVRGLFGFEWLPEPTRFGVYAELGPDLLLTPGFGATIDVEAGGRFYF